MAKNILVATPQPAFGEFLRLSLEESNHYRVRLVHSGREALTSMEQVIFSLAILDVALTDPPFPYVVQGLRSRRPDIRLLVIPPAEGEDRPEIHAAKPDGCVSQPFYAPSLLETIDHLTAETSPPITAPPPVAAGLQNSVLPGAGQLAQVLEEFLKDSTAPAVLVLRACLPWAWAGQLNRDTLDEVAHLLTRYAEANEGVDIARFVHLQTDGGEYLIYATPLPDGLVLVLIYQVTTPLTVIRAQAIRLTRLLRQPAAAPPTAALLSPPILTQRPILPTPAEDEDQLTDNAESDDARLEADARRLVDLLEEMPEPNPVAPEPSDWVREESQTSSSANFLFPWERGQNRADAASAPTIPIPVAAAPARPVPGNFPPEMLVNAPGQSDENDGSEELAKTDLDADGEQADRTMPTNTLPPAATLTDWLASAPPATGEDTRPVVLRTLQSLKQVEPIMPSFSHLAYTCLLIPRLPGHMLVGELANRLQEWLPQLCLAYSWRLENLLVRPDYLQMTVHVAPAISPGNVIRLVRQQASRRIFLRFPQYEVENPSGDFWAPGFLILSGFQPPSLNVVQDFIRQTRTRQGNLTH